MALPLDAINKASAREKSIRQGHPSTFHRWWARRPLAAARAVIFAQMVDDPSEYVDELLADPKLRRKAESLLKVRRKRWEDACELARKAREFVMDVPDPGPQPKLEEVIADQERERLFKIIEDLVQWENTANEPIIQAARDEILQTWLRTCVDNAGHEQVATLFNRHELPAFHDPFAGGGSLPLEAQRLGLRTYATDLNPVSVLINKAMVEIPPKFAGRPPVNSADRKDRQLFQRDWRGAQGLAADIRHFGKWLRDEAERRIGQLYAKAEVTREAAHDQPELLPLVGKKVTVIAWVWARTVRSPNPAFAHVHVPLASSFMLCARGGSEAYVEPYIQANSPSYIFTVKSGKPKNPESAKAGTAAGKRGGFRCLLSGVPITYDYIREEGQSGRLGARLMAVIAEGERGRIYLPPTSEVESLASRANEMPYWKPETPLDGKCRVNVALYGLDIYADLFTPRQLVALTTLSDLVSEVRDKVKKEWLEEGLSDDGLSLSVGGTGGTAYAEAISLYLGLAVDKVAEGSTTLCTWSPLPKNLLVISTFGRQALPMTWDYAEANIFADSSGNILRMCELTANVLERQCLDSSAPASASQMDAGVLQLEQPRVISTDPPYYDNIGYADLSEFFYVWLRRSLRTTFPDLFATLAVPKTEELVATPYRHGSKEKAESFFIHGMTKAMRQLASQSHPSYPVTIYYAFRQSESDGAEGTTSTGWDSFLEAVIRAGFGITGTWPVRTERAGGFRNNEQNALASSVVLVCRPRAESAPTATRREFVNALKQELPAALASLQSGNIAPVDLAQAAIGPGMAAYTRYSKVLDAEGKQVSVRDALALINHTLDEVLAAQEGDFDADSRWALAWFEQSAFDEGEYGVAETLSKAKNTSVSGLVQAGILTSKGGKVRLLRPEELPPDWDPTTDPRLTTWEMVHHLIRALESGGESAAALLVAKLGSKAETARELCYRLYTICERKKRAAEALSYNALVQSWPEITRLAQSSRKHVEQGELFTEVEA